MDNIVALIPARGGSKSIPLKNCIPVASKPLIYWTIEAAIRCQHIDKLYVAADSEEIKECVAKINHPKLKIINRDPANATDQATTESLMLEFASNYEFKHLVLIQATSPLCTSTDLTNAIQKYHASGADSLLSVVRQKRFLWEQKNQFAFPVNYSISSRPRRQDFDGFLVENGAFYITGKKNLMDSKLRLSGNIATYEMDESTYVEMDEPADLLIIENLLKQKNFVTYISDKLKKIKLVATDVDGVLTDAGMYYSEKGDELKKFNTRDGMGFKLLKDSGIKTAIITTENTDIVNRRAKKLKVDYLFQGITNKKEIIKELAKKENISVDEIAFIGDDINDLAALSIVGFAACPANAEKQIMTIADYICSLNGGQGCFREVCNILVDHQIFKSK
ncbi:MAG: HAD-IIIA family hydrolase [Bacteroidales bacterium]